MAKPEQARSLENAARAVGHKIFSLMEEKPPSIFESKWWEEEVLGWLMQDEHLKTAALRFVDVFPALHTPEAVALHLRQYFPSGDRRFPAALRLGSVLATPALLTQRALAYETRAIITRMARHFIAGATAEEAFEAIKKLETLGMSFTLDLLGEAVVNEKEADGYMQKYLDLLSALDGLMKTSPLPKNLNNLKNLKLSGPRLNISLKLSSLYSQFDPINPQGTTQAVKARLRQILTLAKSLGAFVNIDVEQYRIRDLTFKIFQEIALEKDFKDYPHLGIVIQAYLRDAEKFTEEFLRWAKKRGAPLTVRLVKGAYWEYEVINARQRHWPVPVFTDKAETDACFESITGRLLKNYPLITTAVGSHNIRSMAQALALAESMKKPQALEIQMLYGMGDNIKHALLIMGHTVRIYTPYGQLVPGMGYLVRRMLENTSTESFLRHSRLHDVSTEALLRSPQEFITAPPRPARTKPQPEEVVGSFVNDPDTDFSLKDAREKMQAALEEVERHLGREYPLVLGGEKIHKAEKIISLNPSDFEQIIGKVSKASVEEAHLALHLAKAAQPAWGNKPFAERAAVLIKAARLMRARRLELAAWEILEAGKNWREADADVAEAVDYLEYYAREMLRLGAPRLTEKLPGEDNFYRYRPLGVGAVIAPWNFPLAILTGMTGAALAAGNAVVMKPAKQTPVIAYQLREILHQAGLPAGVLHYLPGIGGEVGPALVGSPLLNFAAFTGSQAVGLSINALAAQMQKGQQGIKRVVAEMGGKNAIIVDASADLDDAVLGTIASAFGYQGQKCSACSRVIVLESVYDTFLERLIESARSLKIGPAQDPANFMGPLIDQDAYQKVRRYIEIGNQEARPVLAVDAAEQAQKGYFIGPYIFADVPINAKIAQEEIFGPVLAVFKAKNFNEALAMANSTAFALTGGVYSRTPDNIEQAKEEFLAGNFYINRKITGALVGRQPFGGFRMSGIGSKAGGPDYLRQFMWPQTVTENTLRRGFAPMEEGKADSIQHTVDSRQG